MIVVLFRHGPAGRRDAARWPDDGERPLTRRGCERTRLAAYGLARLVRKTTAVITSPLVRSAQTAAILHDVLAPARDVETLDALAPGGSVRAVIRRLEQGESGQVLVLVGHEPDLGRLAGTLVFGGAQSQLPLKKAGASLISFVGAVRAGDGHLTALLPPRLLRRVAGRKHA